MRLLDEPLLTEVLARGEFQCVGSAVYIFGSVAEQRSVIDEEWTDREQDAGTRFIQISDEDQDQFEVLGDGTYSLHSQSQLKDLVDSFDKRPVYLDVTGLSHHVWAPLLRALVEFASPSLYVAYMEPQSYRPKKNPRKGNFYDLSVGTEGIRPLPGFSFVRRRAWQNEVFVPLIGFEGARFARLLNHVEPERGRTLPIVGVPGFRLDYPFVTYWGNEAQLEQDGIYRDVRFAVANDPFAAFHSLRVIAEENPESLMRVAPIGTKPHGVGAVLFALSAPERVELIYDHPRRKANRTSGSARLCVSDVGAFVRSELYRWEGELALGQLPT